MYRKWFHGSCRGRGYIWGLLADQTHQQLPYLQVTTGIPNDPRKYLENSLNPSFDPDKPQTLGHNMPSNMVKCAREIDLEGVDKIETMRILASQFDLSAAGSLLKRNFV